MAPTGAEVGEAHAAHHEHHVGRHEHVAGGRQVVHEAVVGEHRHVHVGGGPLASHQLRVLVGDEEGKADVEGGWKDEHDEGAATHVAEHVSPARRLGAATHHVAATVAQRTELRRVAEEEGAHHVASHADRRLTLGLQQRVVDVDVELRHPRRQHRVARQVGHSAT